MNLKMKIYRMLRNITRRALLTISVVFIASSIFTIIFMVKPRYINKEIEVDMLSQNTSFDYKVKNLPNELKEFEGTIFPKVQNKINISIKSVLISQNPVHVSGTYFINLKLIAEDLWEQNIYLTPKNNFDSTGVDSILVNEDIVVDLSKILNDIEIISNDIIGVRPSKYLLVIQPVIEGMAVHNNKEILFDSESEIVFHLDSAQVRLDEGQQMQFETMTPIKEQIVEEQFAKLFGFKFKISFLRYISFSIFIVFSLLIILIFILNKSDIKLPVIPIQEIDKKYHNRLIVIDQSIEDSYFYSIPIKPLKALVRIADEKDQFILKYINKIENKIFYYVIVGNQLYTHELKIV